MKPLLALTTFARTEKADKQLASMIAILHGRGTTIPKP
jgi:aldehyde dehydrogenase (NAD+)